MGCMSLIHQPPLISNHLLDRIYNKTGRTYLFDIDFHHLKEGNPDWVVSFTVDAFHAGNVSSRFSFESNCFHLLFL